MHNIHAYLKRLPILCGHPAIIFVPYYFLCCLQNSILAKCSQDVVIQEYKPETDASEGDNPTPTGATEGELPGYGEEDLTPTFSHHDRSQVLDDVEGGDNTTNEVIA